MIPQEIDAFYGIDLLFITVLLSFTTSIVVPVQGIHDINQWCFISRASTYCPPNFVSLYATRITPTATDQTGILFYTTRIV